MSITSTELKMNLSKYLIMSEKEDIFITKNGRVIAKLSNPYKDRVEEIKTLFGVLPADIDCEKELEERRNNL